MLELQSLAFGWPSVRLLVGTLQSSSRTVSHDAYLALKSVPDPQNASNAELPQLARGFV